MTDRLGVAGFWGSEALERGNGLMNGIHDQIVALQWVHQHAALFGADPQQITIFVGHRRPLAAFLLRSALLDGCATARAQGESAGGQSTCALTVSPAAKGLFLRSIIESGACTGPWSPGTTKNSLAKSSALATSLHAPTSPMEQLAFMRKLDAKALFAASKGSFGAGSWAPDNGLVFPDDKRRPIDYYKAGQMNTNEIIVGGNSMDALGAYMLPAGQTLSQAEYAGWMASWGENIKAVEAQYPLSRFWGNTNAAVIQPQGDCDVVCSQYELASIIASHGGHAFVYYFDYGPACGDVALRRGLTKEWTHGKWASHAAEIPWVFGTATACFRNESELRLTRTIQAFWTSFAKSGVPVAGGVGAWAAYDVAKGNVMVLNLEPHVGHKPALCLPLCCLSLGCALCADGDAAQGEGLRADALARAWLRRPARPAGGGLTTPEGRPLG